MYRSNSLLVLNKFIVFDFEARRELTEKGLVFKNNRLLLPCMWSIKLLLAWDGIDSKEAIFEILEKYNLDMAIGR